MLQVTEIQIILGLAKSEMKQAYRRAVKTGRKLQSTEDKKTLEMSRWQQGSSIRVKADSVKQSVMQVASSGDNGQGNKGPGTSKVFGGNVLSFEQC